MLDASSQESGTVCAIGGSTLFALNVKSVGPRGSKDSCGSCGQVLVETLSLKKKKGSLSLLEIDNRRLWDIRQGIKSDK